MFNKGNGQKLFEMRKNAKILIGHVLVKWCKSEAGQGPIHLAVIPVHSALF